MRKRESHAQVVMRNVKDVLLHSSLMTPAVPCHIARQAGLDFRRSLRSEGRLRELLDLCAPTRAEPPSTPALRIPTYMNT
jgi:hypothetical protein